MSSKSDSEIHVHGSSSREQNDQNLWLAIKMSPKSDKLARVLNWFLGFFAEIELQGPDQAIISGFQHKLFITTVQSQKIDT